MGYASNIPLPELDEGAAFSDTSFSAHVKFPDRHLVGALAEPNLKRLKFMDLTTDRFGVPETPHSHSIFSKENPKFNSIKLSDLPTGLKYGELTDREHFLLVTKRTDIPRKASTLMSMKCEAILFPRKEISETAVPDDPVAWAFIGNDGALASLHVEQEWRGKGLAKKLAVRIVKESMGEEGLGHAYVAVDNMSSQGVCRSIGGVSDMNRYWILVDLAKVRRKILQHTKEKVSIESI
jgi:hypothetical protein